MYRIVNTLHKGDKYYNNNTYIHTYKQTVDHILYDCTLVEQERDSVKAAVLQTENWPVSKNKLINKFHKYFKKCTKKYPLTNYRKLELI